MSCVSVFLIGFNFNHFDGDLRPGAGECTNQGICFLVSLIGNEHVRLPVFKVLELLGGDGGCVGHDVYAG